MAKASVAETQAAKDNSSKAVLENTSEVSKDPAEPTPVMSPQEPGVICEVKDLYQGTATCVCCMTWAASPQKKITTAVATDTSGYAVLARKSEGHGDYGRDLKLHSIVIQSPLIRKVLDVTLKGYPGIATGLENFTVEAPFQCFYHRWTALVDAYSTSVGETAQHLGLLINLLDGEFRGTQKAVADLLKNNVIEHQYLWTIFQPGHYILTKTHGQDSVLLLDAVTKFDETLSGGPRGFLLTGSYIDYDGSMTGLGTTRIKIPEFRGTTPLSELPAIPFLMHPDREVIEKRRVAEGKRFAAYRTGEFQEYAGRAFSDDRENGNITETQVNGRVMIDPFAYFQFKNHDGLPLRPLGLPAPIVPQPVPRPHHAPPGFLPPPPPPPHPHHPRRMPPPRVIYSNQDRNRHTRPKEADQKELTDNEYLICVPFVRGYSFKSKEWVLLNIEYLRPVQWTEDLFENLVLPAEEKDLLLALAKSHCDAKANTFDDFVIGKGRGMVILLDGPPGVGKTLTAESVAETMKAPLYTMSAGELGTQSNSVEKRLSDILDMASMWNAILLIDEADIFMEQRTPFELDRNELVAIFLRHMEYFHGVMILTTNRVDTMDIAFDSRVDIRLHYPPLPASSRRQIWANFIARLPEKSTFSEDELDQLAELDLNGRQIKSAVKTAQLLSSGKGEAVRMEHIGTVLRITRGVKL
ncbi:P-loop containing nucleoside triphosphate hydrolase protein [Cadophora sp. MPI-SDFR-AT-0126]|nr:P-loop containing nucleoside triphosphate hydrolase protein [Leotiomycetes sp. MPI-SDFR-AT-0126]